MKNLNYIFIILIFLNSSCISKDKKEPNIISERIEISTELEKLNIDSNSNNTLKDWLNYYQKMEPTFSLEQFDFQFTDTLTITQGNVFGNFDKNFDPIYSDFLVYRTDKKQYVDFDSYQWTLDENKTPLFSPDQEINLIDIENQSVNRIGFRGPFQWVENVFWENDSTIVLLENSGDKQPIITKLNLKSKIIKVFNYKDTLDFDSKYSELRFKEKGIKYE